MYLVLFSSSSKAVRIIRGLMVSEILTGLVLVGSSVTFVGFAIGLKRWARAGRKERGPHDAQRRDAEIPARQHVAEGFWTDIYDAQRTSASRSAARPERTAYVSFSEIDLELLAPGDFTIGVGVPAYGSGARGVHKKTRVTAIRDDEIAEEVEEILHGG